MGMKLGTESARVFQKFEKLLPRYGCFRDYFLSTVRRGKRRLMPFFKSCFQFFLKPVFLRGNVGLQGSAVQFKHAFPRADLFVQKRIGKTRLICLVVAVETIAIEIDENVEAETAKYLKRVAHRTNTCLYIFPVHMKNGHVKR